MVKLVYAIEGLDFLGKSTLIQNIRNKLGYYEVIHFSKPQKLQAYENAVHTEYNSASATFSPIPNAGVYHYQRESFINSMILAASGARIIFDRWHLGEAVYAEMYRGYNGNYVFGLEQQHKVESMHDVRLILLTENFEVSTHFKDDGLSLGPTSARAVEQSKFIEAFNQSRIIDKRIICVTDSNTGKFRSQEDILKEATE